jgi:hypothetical protein
MGGIIMEKTKFNIKKLLLIVAILILSIGLCVSIGFNIHFNTYYFNPSKYQFMKYDSYLQSTEQIYVLEAGILRNNLDFHNGTDYEIKYNFSHENFDILKSKYNLESTAKEGTEFEKALRLMNEYAPRLIHKSDYDNHIPINALDLLEYSLDNKSNGINCRNKAQILNEMCLSLGIYSRKVWIMPYSSYDNDCHVVNEVWDTSLNKWVMLDITNNTYWVDENNTPLSIMEIRDNAALRKFCTPIFIGDQTSDLKNLKNKNIGNFLYIVKNMVYMEYCSEYTVGEKNTYVLLPQNIPTESEFLISKNAIERSPINI